MLTSNSSEILQIDTPPPCLSSDAYYEKRLNAIYGPVVKGNARFSRNLFHALHAFFNGAGDDKITIQRQTCEGKPKWRVEFLVNKKPIAVVGRSLPSLICEAALLIKTPI